MPLRTTCEVARNEAGEDSFMMDPLKNWLEETFIQACKDNDRLESLSAGTT